MMTAPTYSPGRFILLSAVFILCSAVAVYFSLYWIAAIPFFIAFFYIGWQQWQFVFLLLLFSLPWSVEYNVTSSLGTDLPDEPLMLVTSLFFLANWFYKPSQIGRTVWRHPLMIFLLLHFLWITVAVLLSTDVLLSLKYWLAKGWYLFAFVFAPIILFRDKKLMGRAAAIFLVSVLILAATVLYRHYYLGLTFAKINDAVAPFFRNHVNYSAMLVCAVPVLVAVYQLNKSWRLILSIMLVMLMIALFFSYSRGAWLALIIGIAAYILIYFKKLFSGFCFLVLLVVGFLFWIKSDDRYLRYAHDYRTTIFHKEFNEHWAATYKLQDVSTAERFNRWIAGVRMIKEKWVSGYGPNSFYYNYKPWAIPAFKTWVSRNDEHSTVHNYFLLLAIEQGIPGVIIFLILVAAMLFYAERLYHRSDDRFYKTAAMCCAVMITMIMVVNFLSDLIESDKIGSLFFLCLGSLIAIDVNSRRERSRI